MRHALMSRLPLRPYGSAFRSPIHYHPEQDPPAPADPKKPDHADDLQAKIDAALKAERERVAAERLKEKEEADRAAAEKNGEYKTLAEKEKAKREEAERTIAQLNLDAKRASVRESIRDYLAANHKGYVGVEKYIQPFVEFDASTAPEDVSKRVKAAADQYVKENPRAAGGGGIPADPRTGRPAGSPGTRPAGPQSRATVGTAGTHF